MIFSEAVLSYYSKLSPPGRLPDDVETMNPFQDADAFALCRQFYEKYYHDENERIICFGINPGRFGGGITGIPFTDPIQLDDSCGIENDLQKKPELSSRFIYEMIHAYGGPGVFYGRFFISAVSPLGYVRDGVNLNYYDIKGYKNIFESYVVDEIKKQLNFNVSKRTAFSIGKGKNLDFLQYLNRRHDLFDKIFPLPHPRWVMQYRLRRKEEFIDEYIKTLKPYHQ